MGRKVDAGRKVDLICMAKALAELFSRAKLETAQLSASRGGRAGRGTEGFDMMSCL